MTILLLSILYLQFVTEFILIQPRNSYYSYIITLLIFLSSIIFLFLKYRNKINFTLVLYLFCLPLALINASFIASANIFGFVLYLRTKRKLSIKNLGWSFFFLNILVFIFLVFRISSNTDLVRPWGEKLGKTVVIHGFNNPNTEAEFFYFFGLSVWFIIKNKYLRLISVMAIMIVGYQFTSGRSYLLASGALIMGDIFINKKRLKYIKSFLIAMPIVVSVMSFVIGVIVRDTDFTFFDTGAYGRFFVFGYFIKRLNFFNLFFGFNIMSEVKSGESYFIPLDVSVFAIFVTRGILMLVLFLILYIKYIWNIGASYYKYVPAMISLIVAGQMLPSMAWFSINMIIFLYLAEDSVKNNAKHNNILAEKSCLTK